MREIIKRILGLTYKALVVNQVRRKIARTYSNLRKSGIKCIKPSPELAARHKMLWGSYKTMINTKWLVVYSTISGLTDYRYIPEDIYYTEIEPRLNNKAFSKAWTDKNFYHHFLDSVNMPEVVLRSVNGIIYSENFTPIGSDDLGLYTGKIRPGKYIIKPTIDTGGGKGIRVITFEEGKIHLNPSLPEIDTWNDLIAYYKESFIVQKYIEQDPFFRKFNPGSLNTIRILTYRSFEKENIVILHKILRIGKPGSVVDNQASGGIACGIRDDNTLSNFGVDKYGNKHFNSGEISFETVGVVPYLDKIAGIALEISGKFFYSRLLGLDFGVDEKGKVYLIEVNDINNEINFYQMNSGPLFGDYSHEVAESCLKEPKSFLLDYNLD